MKTLKKYISGLLLIIGLFLISAYNNSENVKQDKQSKKAARKAEMEANFNVLDSLLRVGRYVLEADYLQNKYGSRIFVTSTLNFIRVDGPKGVLQTGSDSRVGTNGVGGVTAEGNISNYKITRDSKNMTYTVTFNLLTSIGTFDIFLNVRADNNASATISGTTSARLTWDGHLVNLDNSRIFKGFDTI